MREGDVQCRRLLALDICLLRQSLCRCKLASSRLRRFLDCRLRRLKERVYFHTQLFPYRLSHAIQDMFQFLPYCDCRQLLSGGGKLTLNVDVRIVVSVHEWSGTDAAAVRFWLIC